MSAIERHFDTHPELERKPSRKRRSNYKVVQLPPGTARGVEFGREVFRGVGSPMRPAHGKGVQSFIRGDRISTSDDAIWLMAGRGEHHVVSGSGGQVSYDSAMKKLGGKELRALAAGGGPQATKATNELARRKANRQAKKGS